MDRKRTVYVIEARLEGEGWYSFEAWLTPPAAESRLQELRDAPRNAPLQFRLQPYVPEEA